MGAPWTWVTTDPTGAEAPGTIDDIIRAMKVTLDEFFKTFSNFPTNGTLKAGTALVITDLYANIPAAGTDGRLFIATDTGRMYYDNGASWVLIGSGSSKAVIPIYMGGGGSEDGDFTTTSYVDMPNDPSHHAWASGEGVTITTTDWPATATYTLRTIVETANAPATVRLWDATANAAVTGSETTGAGTDCTEEIVSGSLTLSAGSHALRLQAKKGSSATSTNHIMQAVIEVTW